jgi:uridine kinase
MDPMKRIKLLHSLAEMILQVESDHPVRVAIDGVDAAGKTILADQLAETLRNGNRQIIRASVDDFHHPQHIRRQHGDLSPQGFYHDSFNYPALINDLLEPLSPNGDRRYRTAVFDLQHDQPVERPWATAPQDAILVIDGIFLLRPCLMPYWDLTIYLNVDFTHSMARGIQRDAAFYGSMEAAEQRYLQRYIPGQQLYHQAAQPLDKADILIDNNDLEAPEFIRVPPHLLSGVGL